MEVTELIQRIREIESHFCNVEELDVDSDCKEDFIRAFVMLCHAEFESYIEGVAATIIDNSKRIWDLKKVANYNLAALFVFHEKNCDGKDNETHINKIINDYRRIIKDNHGIKEHNIKALFSPLGYDLDDFDASFLSELSSFGSDRGEISHTSGKLRIRTSLNMDDKKNMVEHIMDCIPDFEQSIRNKQNLTED